jgi:hypothetical protein
MSIRPEDYDRFFRTVYGRRCNALNERYALPADDEELKVRAPLSPPEFEADSGTIIIHIAF